MLVWSDDGGIDNIPQRNYSKIQKKSRLQTGIKSSGRHGNHGQLGKLRTWGEVCGKLRSAGPVSKWPFSLCCCWQLLVTVKKTKRCRQPKRLSREPPQGSNKVLGFFLKIWAFPSLFSDTISQTAHNIRLEHTGTFTSLLLFCSWLC